MRRVRPHVVITFGPEGAYGHPDHIAISQLTTAAIVYAVDASYESRQPLASHCVSKLYYTAWNHAKWTAFQTALREIKMNIDGMERRATPWPDWAITTFIDTESQWPAVWRAVSCHKSQMAIYRQLEHLPEEHRKALWGLQEYCPVFSLANGGRQHESDFFEGLR